MSRWNVIRRKAIAFALDLEFISCRTKLENIFKMVKSETQKDKIEFFCLFHSKGGFTMLLRLSWNSLCSPGWPMAILLPQLPDSWDYKLVPPHWWWHKVLNTYYFSVREIAQWLSTYWVQFPAPMWWLTTTCNSGSLPVSAGALCFKVFTGFSVTNHQKKKKAERKPLIYIG